MSRREKHVMVKGRKRGTRSGAKKRAEEKRRSEMLRKEPKYTHVPKDTLNEMQRHLFDMCFNPYKCKDKEIHQLTYKSIFDITALTYNQENKAFQDHIKISILEDLLKHLTEKSKDKKNKGGMDPEKYKELFINTMLFTIDRCTPHEIIANHATIFIFSQIAQKYLESNRHLAYRIDYCTEQEIVATNLTAFTASRIGKRNSQDLSEQRINEKIRRYREDSKKTLSDKIDNYPGNINAETAEENLHEFFNELLAKELVMYRRNFSKPFPIPSTSSILTGIAGAAAFFGYARSFSTLAGIALFGYSAWRYLQSPRTRTSHACQQFIQNTYLKELKKHINFGNKTVTTYLKDMINVMTPNDIDYSFDEYCNTNKKLTFLTILSILYKSHINTQYEASLVVKANEISVRMEERTTKEVHYVENLYKRSKVHTAAKCRKKVKKSKSRCHVVSTLTKWILTQAPDEGRLVTKNKSAIFFMISAGTLNNLNHNLQEQEVIEKILNPENDMKFAAKKGQDGFCRLNGEDGYEYKPKGTHGNIRLFFYPSNDECFAQYGEKGKNVPIPVYKYIRSGTK